MTQPFRMTRRTQPRRSATGSPWRSRRGGSWPAWRGPTPCIHQGRGGTVIGHKVGSQEHISAGQPAHRKHADIATGCFLPGGGGGVWGGVDSTTQTRVIVAIPPRALCMFELPRAHTQSQIIKHKQSRPTGQGVQGGAERCAEMDGGGGTGSAAGPARAQRAAGVLGGCRHLVARSVAVVAVRDERAAAGPRSSG